MAIFHLAAKTVARASGRSAVAAAAYRCGVRLVNARDGLAHDFRARSGVVSTFIAAPDAAPSWMLDRQALWSAAEIRETRLNAVTAREWEAALPDELDAGQREALARQFAAAMVERFGLVADCAIHAPSGEGDQRNHHLHMLTTTRAVDGDGFGAKTRALDDRKSGAVEEVRALWEKLANDALAAARQEARIDRRSLRAQETEARQEAVSASQDAEKAARSLNPIGKRQRVQRATESAQEAAQRAEALSREPTTHDGPERTAMRRRKAEKDKQAAAVKKRATGIVGWLNAAANRVGLRTIAETSPAYEAADKQAFERAVGFLDEMLSGIGAGAWAKGFIGRGGWVAKVFGERLHDERLNPAKEEGEPLAELVAHHIGYSDERAAIVAWSAAAAEYEGPRLEARQREAEESQKRGAEILRNAAQRDADEVARMERLSIKVRNVLPILERRAAQYFKENVAESGSAEEARERSRRELRGRLNEEFQSRVWPEQIQREFERVTALEFLAPPEPKPAPAVEPEPPKPEAPKPEAPRYRGTSGPSM